MIAPADGRNAVGDTDDDDECKQGEFGAGEKKTIQDGALSLDRE